MPLVPIDINQIQLDKPAKGGLRPIDISTIQLDAPQQPSFTQMAIENLKGGVQAGKDLATGNYQSIGEYKPTPKTEFLANKLFPQGYEGGMPNLSNVTRQDVAGALVEKFGESPQGKAASAIGGVVPSMNLIGTAFQKYAAPAITEATGLTNDELAVAGMLAAPLGLKALPKTKPTGLATQPPRQSFFSGLPDAALAKAITYPVRSPVKTAGFVVDTAGKVLSPIASKATKSLLESDSRILGGGLKRDLQSPVAQEGARLGEKFGVDFTAGELTGNKAAMGFEDVFANSPAYADRIARANEVKVNKIVGAFNDELSKIYPESGTKADVGFSLGTAYRSTLDSLIKTRREQAKIDFEAALQNTGEADILSNNLFTELNAIAAEGNAKLLTKSKAYGSRLANSLLKRVSSKTGKGNVQADRITIQDMANGLSDFSSEAQRPGSIMDNAQSAAERRVYSRLYNALLKDLDTEIQNPKGNPERAAMLAIARDNYARNSNRISDLNKTTLGKVIGEADFNSAGELVVQPEILADRFAKLPPTELAKTMKFLDENHPDVANMGRRHVLERALNIAEEGRGLRGEGTTKDFAKAQFVQNLPNKESLTALLGDKFAAQNVLDVAAAMNRMIDYGASQKGSQTFGRGEFNKSFMDKAKGALYNAITSDSLVDDLLNPKKAAQLSFEAKKINGDRKPLKVPSRTEQGLPPKKY